MFKGFPEAYMSYLMALEMNNNKHFFEENRALYERVLRDPLYALAEALAPCVLEIDPSFDVRPSRAVSRIRRDTRFTNDKSPYRTYMWVGFRHLGEGREETCGFYFDISRQAAHFGCGYYHMRPQYMEKLRELILSRPAHVEKIISEERFADLFELKGESYQRKYTPPRRLSLLLSDLYQRKNLYAEHTIDDLSLLFSKELVNVLADGFRTLAPFYTLLSDCMRVANEGNNKEGAQ